MAVHLVKKKLIRFFDNIFLLKLFFIDIEMCKDRKKDAPSLFLFECKNFDLTSLWLALIPPWPYFTAPILRPLWSKCSHVALLWLQSDSHLRHNSKGSGDTRARQPKPAWIWVSAELLNWLTDLQHHAFFLLIGAHSLTHKLKLTQRSDSSKSKSSPRQMKPFWLLWSPKTTTFSEKRLRPDENN